MRKKFTNKLLQEAIADAEVLHDSAVATARIALEESFTPRIKSMIATKLRESDKDEWYMDSGPEPFVDENDDNDADDVDEASDPFPATKPNSFGQVEEAKEKVDYKSSGVGSSGDSGISEPEGLPTKNTKGPSPTLKSSDIANDSETSGMDDRGAAKGDKEGQDWSTDGPELMDENTLEEALDLETIIRELQKDVDSLAQMEIGGAAPGSNDDDLEDPMGDPMAGGMEDPMAGGDLESDPMGDTPPEAPTGGAPQGGVPGMDAPTGAPDLGAEPGVDDFGGEDDDEDIDLEEILREIEAEATTNQGAQMATENKRLKLELGEAMQAVKLLHGKLNEVNLLNAKLLHTTKLFRVGLTNEQKAKIVEQFDRATTLREVKLLYSALAETLLEGRSTARKRSSTKEVVSEGLASKATGSKKVINEQSNSGIVSTDAVKRMQQLAGILKS